MFSGTPCQIAGLNAFLGRKYDNLLTVDVVCHGVPSPLAFRRYAEELTEEGKEKVLAVNFRDKVRGWYPYFLTVKTEENVYSSDCRENEFMRAFLANLCLRKSCAACPFARFPRQGDLTLGDFWGIGRHAPDLDDNLGTSLVLINTERGRRRMAELTPRLKFRRSLPLARAIEGNPSLVRPPVPHPRRDYFFARLEQLPFKQNVSHCFNNRYDCGILNFWFGSNYGAMLTCYALQESVKRLGLKPKVINYVPANVNFAGSLAETFAGKYLDLTELCTNAEELRRLFIQKIACVEIRDSGPGVPAEEMEHITEPFFRGEQAKKYPGGSGLGMSIVKHCVEACGGELHYYNQYPKGFTVSITLKACDK